jgi:predicted nuclease of predicted toxin-antitoxin system
MLAGYADVHLPSAVVAGLRMRGMNVVTAQERGQCTEDDEVLLAAATAEGRLLLSRDKDFFRIHNEWMNAGKSHAGILFLRSRLSIGETIRRTVRFASQTAAADAINVLKVL